MPDPFSDESQSGRLLAQSTPGDNAAPESVSELSGRLKRMVEREFGQVRLRGEISGYKRAASGHVYLALKDENAVIDAVIWKGAAAAIPFVPQDGLEVVATGKITTYPGRSKYQIVIDRLELAGEGALMALLERNKARFEAEGLFAKGKARAPMPYLPGVIGVVTSPTGAVIRDILHRLADRWPSHVVVWPVLVQGDGAARQVAAAIRGFDALTPGGPVPRPDLLIVARGGGSIEDLWAFNEEPVVRAIAECSIPVISAVGHETDTTLADYAADRRAPTPTAAAEMAVPVRAEVRLTVDGLGARAERLARRYAERAGERLAAIARLMPRPDLLLSPQRQRLDEAGQRLGLGLERRIALARRRLDQFDARLRPDVLARKATLAGERLDALSRRMTPQVIERRIAADRQRLDALSRLLDAANPDNLLKKGYVRVSARIGDKPVVTAEAARAAGALVLHFGDGDVDARVERGGGKPYPDAKPEQPSLL
ncbi:exodeoxyribonuclease VII large subunit [Sphingomonas sp. BGYR3]|uniref:exodeoxyribonuclease VII large subunit n=1 Tax=Sphingomonas sp. BGYR3 TaxID=2975483 RepID=UPI0021A30FA1|nr:exodeoxyribonuclease VII large subunit [Sphingomonas sp. BGYR3]MDG5487957.1 exodeoxyribonuclease VII large subunit [Sphingomonas sp. BGYR3]